MLVKLILLAILSGILYRLGGKKGYNTKIRDLGCPLITLVALWFLAGFKFPYWWAYFLTYGLTFAALTTYYDSIFGYDNFYVHGLGIGLASLLLIYLDWRLIFLRAVILMLGIGLLNKYANKWKLPHSDFIEEFGRGALIIITLPILLSNHF